jgi:hypothetical protein
MAAPNLSPDRGEIVYGLSPASFSNRAYLYPLKVQRLTAKQIITVDPDGREHRFWRDRPAEVGGGFPRALRLYLIRPDGYAIVPRWRDHEWANEAV